MWRIIEVMWMCFLFLSLEWDHNSQIWSFYICRKFISENLTDLQYFRLVSWQFNFIYSSIVITPSQILIILFNLAVLKQKDKFSYFCSFSFWVDPQHCREHFFFKSIVLCTKTLLLPCTLVLSSGFRGYQWGESSPSLLLCMIS